MMLLRLTTKNISNVNFSDLKLIDSSLICVSGNTCDFEIDGISHSESPQDHTFCFIKSKRYFDLLGVRCNQKKFPLTGLVIEESYYHQVKDSLIDRFAWVATTKSVDQAMCLLSKPFYDRKFQKLNCEVDGRKLGTTSIDSSARIAENVFIGEHVSIAKDVEIHPGVTIYPHVSIGEGSTIYSNTTIYSYTKIGENCRIHAQVSIGADGFGYQFFNGRHNKVWHFSGVQIGNDVEIGSLSSVDAGAFIPTSIGDGTKIDNGVQVGHNVFIGKHCVLCGKVAVAGSCYIEDYVVMGGGAGLAPGVRIGANSQLAAKATVRDNTYWPQDSVLGGDPAMPLKEWMRFQARLRILGKRS